MGQLLVNIYHSHKLGTHRISKGSDSTVHIVILLMAEILHHLGCMKPCSK